MLIMPRLGSRSQLPRHPAAVYNGQQTTLPPPHPWDRPLKGVEEQLAHLLQLVDVAVRVRACSAPSWPQTDLELLACGGKRCVCQAISEEGWFNAYICMMCQKSRHGQ